MLTILPSFPDLLSEMRGNLTYASDLDRGRRALGARSAMSGRLRWSFLQLLVVLHVFKYLLSGGIIQIDCSVDAPAHKPKSQTNLPMTALQIMFSNYSNWCFLFVQTKILVPSIGEEEDMTGIEFVCGWRIMSFIHTLVFDEEINVGISLPIMNIDQNIDYYCFVLYSWEHTFLGFLKLLGFFFLVWPYGEHPSSK